MVKCTKSWCRNCKTSSEIQPVSHDYIQKAGNLHERGRATLDTTSAGNTIRVHVYCFLVCKRPCVTTRICISPSISACHYPHPATHIVSRCRLVVTQALQRLRMDMGRPGWLWAGTQGYWRLISQLDTRPTHRTQAPGKATRPTCHLLQAQWGHRPPTRCRQSSRTPCPSRHMDSTERCPSSHAC